MNDLHVLVDFENVQPTFDEIAKLAPGVREVWLFHGPHQIKLAEQFKGEHVGVTPVPISKTGKNALDFHLSFYLGYVAAKNPDGRLIVIANDKGYDPMIVHAKSLGFTTQRVGFKAKKTVTAKKVPPAKKAPAANSAISVKQKAAAKTVTPAKKAVAKKASAVKPLPAKKAAPAKKAVVSKKAPAAKVPMRTPEGVLLKRITNGLAKMGDKRPEKLESFMRHIESMLGKDTKSGAVETMVQRLQNAGTIQIAGDKVVHI